MVGVTRGEHKLYIMGTYIMVFSTLLLLAELLCFNTLVLQWLMDAGGCPEQKQWGLQTVLG